MANTQIKRPTIKDIVAYPVMDEGDCELIQELRRMNQENPRPIEKVICPYFSFHEQLTSDYEDEGAVKLIQTLEDKFKNFHAFNFTIRNSLVFEDDIAGYLVGLVAMEGLSQFLSLSSLICTTVEVQGSYLPNILIAYRRYYKDAKVVLDMLKQEDLEIQGRIKKLSIREFETNSHKIIHEINFKS